LTDRIELRGIEVYARHGVLAEEQERAQVFKVDVTVHTDLSRPAETDDLTDAIDYSVVALQVREIVGSETHRLIETVAMQVCDVVLSHPGVTRAVVTIHKPDAPIDMVFDDVLVTVDRSRDPSAS
jgi:dihydroneopterin aldolase